MTTATATARRLLADVDQLVMTDAERVLVLALLRQVEALDAGRRVLRDDLHRLAAALVDRGAAELAEALKRAGG